MLASATYSYDNNGNTTSDGLKNLQITYNILNLPQKVSQSGTTKATYTWFADGSKYTALDNVGNGYHYIGSLIYNTSANATTTLESTDFSQGRITLSGNTQTIHYHHRDHLGSVRAITNGNGTVIEQNDYYPFGGRHTFGRNYTQTSTNRYKFNGKEEQTLGSLDLLDYGARMYNTKTARWLVQDPLAEEMYNITPYRFSMNNPINMIDPQGMDEWRFNIAGKRLEPVKSNTEKDIIVIYDDHDNPIGQIDFKYGSIKEFNYTVNELMEDGTEKDVSYKYYKINDYESAKQIFEFFAYYTNIEWGLINLKDINSQETYSYLTTSHQNNTNKGTRDVLNHTKAWKDNIAESIIHNHPSGSKTPSGNKPNDTNGDIPFAKAVSRLFKNQPQFQIFTLPSTYTTYFPLKCTN